MQIAQTSTTSSFTQQTSQNTFTETSNKESANTNILNKEQENKNNNVQKLAAEVTGLGNNLDIVA